MEEIPRFLRAKEVAELLSMSVSNVYKQIESGDLPSVRIGSSVRVPSGALVRLLQDPAPPANVTVGTDPVAACDDFHRRTSATPESYVEQWRAGTITDDAASAGLLVEALALRGAAHAAAKGNAKSA